MLLGGLLAYQSDERNRYLLFFSDILTQESGLVSFRRRPLHHSTMFLNPTRVFMNTGNPSIKEADNELTLKLTTAPFILIEHSHKLLFFHEETVRYDTEPDKEELN